LNYATRRDIGRLKVEVLANYLRERATAANFRVDPVEAAVYEEKRLSCGAGLRSPFFLCGPALGSACSQPDTFSHLIPVIDGGIRVPSNRLGRLAAADWRAHTATIGRPCLQCLGQYDPGHVQMEREGLLDDPKYIEGLPKDHPSKSRENVFAFSMSRASLQTLQMLALVLVPLDLPNPGSQLYHFVEGHMEEPTFGSCHPECLFPSVIALGDSCGVNVTGEPAKSREPLPAPAPFLL
jgi:hypothetical protein